MKCCYKHLTSWGGVTTCMWFATSPTPFSVGAHLKATRISIHSILFSSASERWHGKGKVLSLIFINRAGESSEGDQITGFPDFDTD